MNQKTKFIGKSIFFYCLQTMKETCFSFRMATFILKLVVQILDTGIAVQSFIWIGKMAGNGGEIINVT